MKTVVEAGHYYACTGPTDLSVLGWDIGTQLAAEQPSLRALFVDDYHPESSFAIDGDAPAPPGTAELLVAEADQVFYESVFAATAPTAVAKLLESGQAKKKGEGVFVGGVRLGTYLEDGKFKPTCTFMDYLLLCEKAAMGGDQVTVLPDTFESQQSGLLVVANRITVDGLRSYVAELFNSDGKVSKELIL